VLIPVSDNLDLRILDEGDAEEATNTRSRGSRSGSASLGWGVLWSL
jgi:hypothetical protein